MMKLTLILSILLNVVLLAGGYYALSSLGGPRYVWYKMNNRGMTGVYGHRKMQLRMLPTQSTDIIMLGNSITEAGEWAEWLDNPAVKNRGISGEGTQGLLDRLSDITKGQPRQIFLMMGINDLLFHDASFTLTHYETIVQRIRKESPNTELVLQSVLPTNDAVRHIGISISEIQRLNTGIRQIANTTNLQYLDIYALLKDENDRLDEQYTDDGIHLNGEAYRIWINYLRAYIAAPPK